jgi:hypothetical protein
LGAGAQKRAIFRQLPPSQLSSRRILFSLSSKYFNERFAAPKPAICLSSGNKKPSRWAGFLAGLWRRARASLERRARLVLLLSQVNLGGAVASRWAVHRLGKTQYVFALVKNTAADAFVGGDLFRVLTGVPPKSQSIYGNAKNFSSFTRGDVVVHAAVLFQKNQRFVCQSGLSTRTVNIR